MNQNATLTHLPCLQEVSSVIDRLSGAVERKELIAGL